MTSLVTPMTRPGGSNYISAGKRGLIAGNRQSNREVRGVRSNCDPLDLIERNFVAGAVIQSGGAVAFMRSHRLIVVQRTASLQVCGDFGGAESVTADYDVDAEISCPAQDHAPGIAPGSL